VSFTVGGFFEEGVDGVEEAVDAVELGETLGVLGLDAGEGIAGRIEVMGGDGAGAEDDMGGGAWDAAGEAKAGDGIEDGLDRCAVVEGDNGAEEFSGLLSLVLAGFGGGCPGA
jgi:hypothetical protein